MRVSCAVSRFGAAAPQARLRLRNIPCASLLPCALCKYATGRAGARPRAKSAPSGPPLGHDLRVRHRATRPFQWLFARWRGAAFFGLSVALPAFQRSYGPRHGQFSGFSALASTNGRARSRHFEIRWSGPLHHGMPGPVTAGPFTTGPGPPDPINGRWSGPARLTCLANSFVKQIPSNAPRMTG